MAGREGVSVVRSWRDCKAINVLQIMLAIQYFVFYIKSINNAAGLNIMATIKRFSDTDNGAIELVTLTTMDNKEFATRFPGIKGMRSDGYAMWVGRPAGVASRFVGDTAGLLPVTRAIEYKSQPSKHVCNAKCLAGKHNGTCECQCGGKNHGAGMFTKMLEAA